jgi:hypothetical protein
MTRDGIEMRRKLNYLASEWFVGGICMLIPLIFGVVGCSAGNTNQVPSPDLHVTAERKADTALATVADTVGPADVKSFAGSDHLTVGGPLASVDVVQSPEEKKYFAGFGCVDESDCYGQGKFERDMLHRYPDIARIHFSPPQELGGDKADIALAKQSFRWSLYFAKQITLANGQTLFDFMTRCSKVVSSLNVAEPHWADSENDAPYIYMQYFPVLRQVATGHEFELQILLKRKGDKIEATSPLFSSAILRNSDFMERHGVSCW